MGRFEVAGFAAGTEAVARAMGAATEAGSTTVVGGERRPTRGQRCAPACAHVAAALSPSSPACHAVRAAGGDSVSAVNRLSPVPRVSFISTGGGASLELIRGDLLPGVRALAQAAAE